jgi:predicted outer membrane repeat protein
MNRFLPVPVNRNVDLETRLRPSPPKDLAEGFSAQSKNLRDSLCRQMALRNRPFGLTFLRFCTNSADSEDLSKIMKTFLVGLSILLSAAVAGLSATLTVTNHDDSAPGSLRDAIASAGVGDTILFNLPNPDTITLTSGELLINQDLTITGPGADALTIARSSAAGTPAFLIFSIFSGAVNISGLTVTNGLQAPASTTHGGGLFTQSSASVVLTNCNFTDNHGSDGGAVHSEIGGVRLNYCSLTGNSATGTGGAIFAEGDGQLVVNHCTVSSNSATYGGGGIFTASVAQVEFSTISENTVPAANPGSASGAGIFNQAGTLFINNSTIANNTNARGNGGGVTSQGILTMTQSTIYGNTAQGDGGGIEGVGTFTDSTITNNTALQDPSFSQNVGGGGVEVEGGLTLKNTIIAANHSPSRPDIGLSFSAPLIDSQGYNLIGNGTDAQITPATGDQIGTDQAPIDPLLDALAGNGGPTQTCALLPGSPAINVGDPNAPATDQRFYNRVDAPDIGAYELGGFITTGSHSKEVLLRGIGPSLPLSGTLANPVLELHDSSGAIVATNDNWRKNTNFQDIIDSGLAPTNALESALLITLEPGAYTAIVSGANNGTGIALVEGYDLDLTTDSKLANISTRGLVQTGDNVMIGGVIVSGTLEDSVLLRAIGPSLPVAGALADPFLEFHDANGAIIASNDNWRDSQESDIEATGLAPTDDAESAILVTLEPGAYTAIVSGVGNTTGIALVEAYGLY